MLSGKRIAIVLDSLELGGAERQALRFAEHLHRRDDVEVAIWGLRPAGKVSVRCQELGIPCQSTGVANVVDGVIDKAKNRYRVHRFLNSVKAWRPDILLPYTRFPNILCGSIWNQTGAQTCIWNQRASIAELDGMDGVRDAIVQTPFFVTNSNHARDDLAARYAVADERIRCVYNGVEVSEPLRSQADWRAALGVAEGVFVVTMVANLRPPKDHLCLVRAWERFIAAYQQPARLVLAGYQFESFAEVDREVAALGLTESIIFPGHVDDVAGLLSASDLAVYSSRMEGLPNGVLECMALGLALVATDIPGIREALGKEGQASLVPVGDVAAMAAKLLQLAAESTRREQSGQQLRQRTEDVFMVAKMCAGMEDALVAALALS